MTKFAVTRSFFLIIINYRNLLTGVGYKVVVENADLTVIVEGVAKSIGCFLLVLTES